MASKEQLTAMGLLLKQILKWAAELAPVTSQFPISTAGERPAVDLRQAAYHAISLHLSLFEVRESLRQTALSGRLSEVAALTLMASERLRALATSMAMEAQESNQQRRPWTWDGARVMFDAHVLPTMTKNAACEWDDLIEGRSMHDLDNQLYALVRQTQVRLLQSAPPDHPAVKIQRRGSAHEEHVYEDGRRWCAVCGWIDQMDHPINDNYMLYHLVHHTGGLSQPQRAALDFADAERILEEDR